MQMVKNLLIFASGLGVGVLGTYLYMKDWCEKEISKEIQSYKRDADREDYSERKEENDISEKPAMPEKEVDIMQVRDICDRTNYDGMFKAANAVESVLKGASAVNNPPYIIMPTEYTDTRTHYDKRVMSYYTDGVLTDDSDEIEPDISKVGGPEVFEHFGEYEDGVVHVRNEQLGVDFEIFEENLCYKTDVAGLEE